MKLIPEFLLLCPSAYEFNIIYSKEHIQSAITIEGKSQKNQKNPKSERS